MEKLTTLDDFAIKHSTDKSSKDHQYTDRYSIYLEHYRDIEFNLLEIGVYSGNSTILDE